MVMAIWNVQGCFFPCSVRAPGGGGGTGQRLGPHPGELVGSLHLQGIMGCELKLVLFM